MTSRIVLFLGKHTNITEARYARWDRLGDRSARETLLPWDGLVAEAKTETGTEGPIHVVAICSSGTLSDWQDHLVDDICRAGFKDRAELPIGFLTYDEDGLDPSNFWDLFEKLRVALSGGALNNRVDFVHGRDSQRLAFDRTVGRVVVDITHGFRAIPFIGASALSFAQGSNRRHNKNVTYRICYAAEQAERNGVIPVWDLTPFAEGVELGDSLDAFARHGRADDLSAFFDQSQVPEVQQLAAPMRQFADDLLLMRIPNLLRQSAPALQQALARDLDHLKESFPSVREDLDGLDAQINELVPGGEPRVPISAEGIQSSAVLAQRLWATGRYAELYNLLRESLLSAYSVLALANTPMQPGEGAEFEKQRDMLTKDCNKVGKGDLPQNKNALNYKTELPEIARKAAKQAAEIGKSRNDVAHCSIRGELRPQQELKNSLKDTLNEFLAFVKELG